METRIIEKIGRNKTSEKSFTNEFNVTDLEGETSSADFFYTYKGELLILTRNGMDIPFSEFDEKSQEKIFTEIMNDNYK